jgi:DNA helicase HerA-like ATPase
MTDFEKLGAFYLGKRYDLDARKRSEELVLYDAKDLTTHAVISGMTGSGKTGLGIDLIEEALIDRIPVIAVDPKGDLGNLALRFPALAPSDFRPWIDPQQAANAGATPDGPGLGSRREPARLYQTHVETRADCRDPCVT